MTALFGAPLCACGHTHAAGGDGEDVGCRTCACITFRTASASSLIETMLRGLRASRDCRGERDGDFIRELAVEGLQAAEELRALLIEADSYISHMLHRGSWPNERGDVERLIGRLRREDGSGV